MKQHSCQRSLLKRQRILSQGIAKILKEIKFRRRYNIDNITSDLVNAPVGKIYNYDKTNHSDDLGGKQLYVCKGPSSLKS